MLLPGSNVSYLGVRVKEYLSNKQNSFLTPLIYFCSEIDKTLENMSNHRRNKWIIEGKLRRYVAVKLMLAQSSLKIQRFAVSGYWVTLS